LLRDVYGGTPNLPGIGYNKLAFLPMLEIIYRSISELKD